MRKASVQHKRDSASEVRSLRRLAPFAKNMLIFQEFILISIFF